LKEAGFKVGYHIMTGLPGSNLKKDLQMFKKIFSEESFCPDQLKIYPCQVIKGAKLEELHAKGKYKPYTEKQTSELIVKMMQLIPEYCRVMRVMREIPPAYLVAGISNLGLRKEIEDEIRRKNLKINEIRFREIGFTLRDKRELNQDIKIKKTEYNASNGKEIFIQAVNKDNILFGLLRLRLEKKMPAMIRELHVYGPVVELGKKDEEKFQHKGLGKDLMHEAEKIARASGFKTIKVISGVGVREYYRNLGYELDKEGYMQKNP
jgi:elongator complex protein 3